MFVAGVRLGVWGVGLVVCVCVGGAVLSRCVCVCPVDLFTSIQSVVPSVGADVGGGGGGCGPADERFRAGLQLSAIRGVRGQRGANARRGGASPASHLLRQGGRGHVGCHRRPSLPGSDERVLDRPRCGPGRRP